jgi:hypothetical protein
MAAEVTIQRLQRMAIIATLCLGRPGDLDFGMLLSASVTSVVWIGEVLSVCCDTPKAGGSMSDLGHILNVCSIMIWWSWMRLAPSPQRRPTNTP